MGLFNNSKYQGLLTPQQQQNAGFDAIGDAGFAMLANSGWKTMPTSLGENIGKAGQAFSQSFDRSAQQTIQAQDILAQRAAAQTAAQQAQQKHAAWVAEQDQKKREVAALRAMWAKAGGDPNAPLSEMKATFENQRAIMLERQKYAMKPQNTKQALDTTTGKPTFVTEQQIRDNPDQFKPVPSGMKLVSDGKGGFTMTTGTATADEMGSGPTGKQQDAYMQTVGTINSLDNVMAGYDPSFSTIATQAGASVAALAERAGVELDPARKESLTKFTRWSRDVQDNLSTTLNQLSGAAVSPEEYTRISASLPNKDDSPTEFLAKVKGSRQKLILAAARAYIFQKQGVGGAAKDGRIFDVTLDQMKTRINTRGSQIKAEMMADPNADPAAVSAAVKQKLRYEFGIPTMGGN